LAHTRIGIEFKYLSEFIAILETGLDQKLGDYVGLFDERNQ
jgi:hypothetical protein